MEESKRKLDGEIFLTQEGIKSVAPWEKINLRFSSLKQKRKEDGYLMEIFGSTE